MREKRLGLHSQPSTLLWHASSATLHNRVTTSTPTHPTDRSHAASTPTSRHRSLAAVPPAHAGQLVSPVAHGAKQLESQFGQGSRVAGGEQRSKGRSDNLGARDRRDAERGLREFDEPICCRRLGRHGVSFWLQCIVSCLHHSWRNSRLRSRSSSSSFAPLALFKTLPVAPIFCRRERGASERC